jgi:uncharacterized protein with PQ loop repeat
MPNPHHHQDLRKRAHLRKDKYPNSNKFIAWFDRLIILVGVLNAAATTPQALQIWMSQDASGVSLISWSYYLFGSIMFVIYGLIHKTIPILINYSLCLVIYFFIVIGIVIYS